MVWVLTQEYNEYDQYGEYFIKVYKDKPTHQELTEQCVPTDRLGHVLDGGGRVDVEDSWFYLREYPL